MSILAYRTELLQVGPGATPKWIEQAAEDPAWFWKDAASDLMAMSPGSSGSALFEWYDLFFELGGRFSSNSGRCFSDYTPAGGVHSKSYRQLTSEAERLSVSWRQETDFKLGPGAVVCICLAPSPAYVLCALAAWHAGACVFFLPPEGRTFVSEALDRLILDGGFQSVYVAAGSRSKPWIQGKDGFTALSWEPTRGGVTPAAYRFGATEVALCSLSELGGDCEAICQITAEQLCLGLARDAHLVFRLNPGETLAAPGFCPVQWTPWLVLSAMAAGAHYLELGADELGDGGILTNTEVSVLGVTDATRELLLRDSERLKRPGFRHWFRSVTERGRVEGWSDWASRVSATGIVGTAMWCNTAAAGALLFSRPSADPQNSDLWKAPGLACASCEPNSTDMPPLGDVVEWIPNNKVSGQPGLQGKLTVEAIGAVVVSERSGGLVWIANLGSHREGRVLPEAQMERVLGEQFASRFLGGVLVSLPNSGVRRRGEVALLAYFRPRPDPLPASMAEDVMGLLEYELGARRKPDRVECLELSPAWVDPSAEKLEINRRACAGQYLSGTLWAKARVPVFRQFAVLSRELELLRTLNAELSVGDG